MDTYTFATSAQVDLPIYLKICSLEGKQKQIPFSVLIKNPELRHLGSNQSPISDLYITVQLWASSKPLGVPVQTAYKAFKTTRTWNEWLTMPVCIKDAPVNSQLAITVWDLSPLGGNDAYGHSVPFGGTTISLFDDDGTLKKGRQKCKIYRHKAADGLSNTTTPSAPPQKRRLSPHIDHGPTPEEEELERLEKLLKKHEMGEIPRVDWLDQLVFRAVEKKKLEAEESAKKRAIRNQAVRAKVAVKTNGMTDNLGDDDEEEDEINDHEENFVLYIEFPRFDFPVVFEDFEYPRPPISSYSQQPLSGSNSTLKSPPEVRLGPDIDGAGNDDDDHRIIRIYDPEVGQKGNPCEDKHRRLVRSHRTGIMDRDLKPNPKIRDELNEIMLYGPTQELNSEEKDLVWKFRHHLTRDKRALTKFVKSVNWQDVSEARQAVEILPKWTEIDVDDALELLGPTFDNPAVRAYAVDRLRKSDDEELLLYLLQLVQALKFEAIPAEVAEDITQDSSLTNFLITRAANNPLLGSYFHWYLMVECDDAGPSTISAHRKLFARVEYYFMVELEKHHPEQRKILLRQGELITILTKIAKDIRFSRVNRAVKIEKLKKFLLDPKNELTTIDPPLPLPLDPEILITGCFAEGSNVFKSSLSPLLINFKLSDGRKYPVIFKVGDDLRQDQLVIQIISLMDRLLQKENLDLKLTPYRIIATGANAGAMQFIPSTSLSAASAKYKGSILAYLRANNPDDNEPLGVRKETMDTYIKSCAGYCVITYLLGVGDRHLDNLLIAPDGHFFHADFGFILGRDPKPFAPMMKLCKEMVEGMGGASSPNYLLFKQYCFTAYTTLRKSANLILNLFSLMVDANIPDIRVEPDKAVLKVKERFHLEMSEEEAIRHFEQLIGDSVNAIFGVVIDRLHDFVQGWRA
ncbi:phosphatidylinositol 3-kinase [Blastomyces gilchristii SLH14081]|uniref:Phosphatidylinositol 3-kinase VPS34 n=3 Tax=Blastomyces TaxID=229219 RepID=A0A179UA86_BLAGS|nr:phosphatidylinositol 3-kinase [Blastomyces gilchristii SLH14081]EGE81644.1 phosphatidylinositol 3-kinase [Blastomyces dermatitidis ATCC 18188]OAT04633.1 phosphatidylinositol 3-kinase [Blastomyces gilchristii SLH14081]